MSGTNDQGENTNPAPTDTEAGQPSGQAGSNTGQPGAGAVSLTQAQLDDVIARRLSQQQRHFEAEIARIRSEMTAQGGTPAATPAQTPASGTASTEAPDPVVAQLQAEFKQLKATQEQAATARREAAIMESVTSAMQGKVPPDRQKDALKLLDRSGLKVDDQGVVTGVTEAVDALLKASPYLRANPVSRESPLNPSGSTTPERPFGREANPLLRKTFGSGG